MSTGRRWDIRADGGMPGTWLSSPWTGKLWPTIGGLLDGRVVAMPVPEFAVGRIGDSLTPSGGRVALDRRCDEAGSVTTEAAMLTGRRGHCMRAKPYSRS